MKNRIYQLFVEVIVYRAQTFCQKYLLKHYTT